ncbi:signal peptidase II [Vulcanococcus limneticus]|jgi:signal peptidase II|uniref:signal peptidase II n=1 Tax=Vulcanococcus limneticus TaxID=2170428 RepID=UPI00398C087E
MNPPSSPRSALAGRRRLAAYGLALLVVLVDQLSKAWVVEHLALRGSAPLLPGLLRLQLAYNTGAAFSLLRDSTLALGLVSLVVSLALVVWIQGSGPLRRWQLPAAGLLLGGAVGNGIDRWRLGTVVDFFEFVPVRFPIFNVADVAINLAVLCLLIDLLRRDGPGDQATHDR